jgi:hypothetical protein
MSMPSSQEIKKQIRESLGLPAKQESPHSTELRGRGYHHSSKASGGEDLQIEEPVGCGYASAFHFHATLPRMLGATLIRDEVVQVGEPREKHLLAATGMMESLHRE